MATVAAIEQAGCTPVFADIDPITRCIAPKSIEKRLGPNTRALMPVHIYGQPAEMLKILEIAKAHNLAVVEDCSQAHGAEIDGLKVGTFADISAYSCYPTKNLGGTGDGGMILCRSEEFAEKIKSLRQYGWNEEEKVSSRALIRGLMNFRQPSYESSYNISQMTMPNAGKSLYATTLRSKTYR